LFHVGGVLIWVRTFLAGGASILPTSLRAIDEAIKTHQPSVLSLVPAQLIRLLDDPEMAAILRSCRVILLGGAPSPAWLIEKALELGIPVIPTYGSTEACAQITGVAKDDPRSAYGTVGRPVPYREVRIDTDGSILLGGKTLFKRYLMDGKPHHIREDGFFKTADAGRLDDDGNLVCLGRTDGIFISGGENIHPFEIENHLLALEDVFAAFVVSVPHREFGKVPWAFVETSSAFDEGLVIAGLKNHLPGYKVPKRIIRLDPEEKNGKLKYSREALIALAGKMVQNGQ
jgi:O-succinylbenzoic acid--CoA ligase